MIDKNPIQLLVLEDDTITIMAYQRMFNDWHVPLDIQWSRSIQEAKQLISNNNFDLALLDYHLEDGDSFEIIPLLKGIPIVYVSGIEDLSLAVKAMKKGAYDYVVKDFSNKFTETLPLILEKALYNFEVERKLKETEQRYSSLFQRTNDIIQSVDAEGRFIHVNPAWIEVLGYSEEEAFALNFLDIVHESNQEYCKEVLQKLLVGEDFSNEEMVFQTKSGQKVFLEGSIFLNEEPSKSTIGIFRDITQKKESQKLIEESKLRYDLAVDAGKLGVMDYFLENNKLFIDPKLKALLGYEPSEIEDNLASWGDHVHPEDLEQCGIDLHNFIIGNSPRYEHEYRMIHKDGSIKWILARGRGIRNAENRIYRIIGTGTDVTKQKHIQAKLQQREEELKSINENLETLVNQRTRRLEVSNLALSSEVEKRKVTEKALEKSKEDYQGLFNNAKDAILLFNPIDEEIVDVNKKACEIYGLSYNDFIGLDLKTISKNPSNGEEYIQKLLNSDTNLTFETIHYRSDGREMHIDVSASLVNYQDKKAILSINRDVTEKKEVEALLEEGKKNQISALIDGQEMERKRFAQELHDSLGQLLTAAKLQVKQLQNKSTEPTIESGLNYTKELLDLNMQEVRRISHALMPVMLSDLGLVKSLDKMIGQLSASKSVSIELFHKGSSGRLVKDIEIALYRICQEALNNALKYANASQINVCLEQNSTATVLSIEDNGVGMSKQAISTVLTTPSGNGIYNMKERTDLINGSMKLKQNTNGGLSVIIKVPKK